METRIKRDLLKVKDSYRDFRVYKTRPSYNLEDMILIKILWILLLYS